MKERRSKTELNFWIKTILALGKRWVGLYKRVKPQERAGCFAYERQHLISPPKALPAPPPSSVGLWKDPYPPPETGKIKVKFIFSAGGKKCFSESENDKTQTF